MSSTPSHESTLSGSKGASPWTDANTHFFSLRTASVHAKHLVGHVKSDFRILDLGCGTGSITAGLVELVPHGSVTGVDSDPRSVARGNDLAKNIPNLTFEVADAHNLFQYSDNSFDVVHSHQVILHLPEPVKALSEVYRILKPGGILSLRDSIQMFFTPPDPYIIKAMSWYYNFKAELGVGRRGGLLHHIWANEAGFAWNEMEVGTESTHISTKPELLAFSNGTKNAMREIGIERGYGTKEDCDEIEKHWVSWAQTDGARMVQLDSTLIARK